MFSASPKLIAIIAIFVASCLASPIRPNNTSPKVYIPLPSPTASPSSRQLKQDSADFKLKSLSTRQVEVSIDLDLLGIGQAIAGAISFNDNRDAFVIDTMYKSFYGAGQKYNVMVFNLNVAHHQAFTGVQMYASVKYGDIIYGIWVFECGTFENQGDGGYINWAFMGWFNRNDGHVTFCP